jgi:hypothetical protein
MNKIILITLLSFLSTNIFAFDLDEFKGRIRSHMATMFGEERTEKIFGKQDGSNDIKMILPEIPNIVLDAKNKDFNQKPANKLSTQGEKYNNLSDAEKRNFRVSFLKQLYTETRNSKPKDEDLLRSLNVLQQGGNREGVYRSVTLDRTYAALENYEEKPSEALVNFIQYFTPKYLKKQYQKSSLESLNLWALKRLVTEKCLELVDVLAKKPDDVYRWYAVYSAEIASNYPELWQSKTRKSKNDRYHYKWAQDVPFQHIKSEIIIKNHKLMNYLQKNN